jgi:hypothetical protein
MSGRSTKTSSTVSGRGSVSRDDSSSVDSGVATARASSPWSSIARR